MLKNYKTVAIIIALCGCLQSCGIETIKQGHIGVKRKFGKLQPNSLTSGLYTYNLFTTRILTLPTTLNNMDVTLDLPSKEGLLVSTQISVLYRIKAEYVPNIIATIGNTNYEEVIVMSVFRSAAANVSSRFFAKDMHTSERANIEKGILERMQLLLAPKGFVVENVLLKSIRLPKGLANSIEQKLEAEQEAQRMDFILNREKREAERKRIEAGGVRDAQVIITQGLNPLIIEWKSIETFKQLANSPNTRIVITDGKSSVMIGQDK